MRDRIRRELERLEPSPDGLERTFDWVRRRQRSRRLLSGMLALVVAGAGTFALIRAVGPLNDVTGTGIRVGGTPMAIVDGFDSIWILTCDQGCYGDGRGAVGRVLRVDPTSRRVLASVEVPHPQALAAGEGGVWALDFWGSRVLRIAPDGERVEATIPLELPADLAPGDRAFAPFDVAVGERGVWVSTGRGQVARIDPNTNTVVAMIATPPEATGAVATGLGLVWVSVGVEGLEAINPGTNTLALGPIEITRGDRHLQVDSLAVGGGIVAMSGAVVSGSPPSPTDYQPTGQNGVAVFDPASEEITWSSVEGSGVGIDFASGGFWVPSADRKDLLRVEPLSLRASGRLSLGGTTYFVAAERVWVLDRGRVLRPKNLAISTPSPPNTEVRLFLAGDGEMWVVGTGRGSVRHLRLPELSPGDPPYRIVRRGDKLVLWGYTTYVLDPTMDTRPKVLVKDSLVFMPSATPDRVWVAVDSSDTGHIGAIREISVDGRITIPDTKTPNGQWPLAAVTSGLIFQLPDGRLEVWNPETGAVMRRLPVGFPVATHRSLLAWCAEPCAVLHETRVDVGGGETIDVRLPAGTSGFDRGVFSPDGETIAVSVHTGPLLEGLTTLRSQLALVDVRSGTARLIDGTAVEGPYAFVDWSPSGDGVFITGGSRFAERSIIEYDVETGRAKRLSVQVGDFYGMAAA